MKNLESEKVSFSSKYTDEICQLLSENTVLKSKLERVEAGKQNQDFQSVSKIQNLTADLNSREEQLKVVNNALNKLRGEKKTCYIGSVTVFRLKIFRKFPVYFSDGILDFS